MNIFWTDVLPSILTLLLGAITLIILWLTPARRFETLSCGAILVFLMLGYQTMGTVVQAFGTSVPGGTLLFCCALSIVGLVAARGGTDTAFRFSQNITFMFTLAVVVEIGKALFSEPLTDYARWAARMDDARNAFLCLVGFHLYCNVYLFVRRYTPHVKWLRMWRWFIGFSFGTLIFYPIALGAVDIALRLGEPAPIGADPHGLLGWVVRTLSHAGLVLVTMTMRWLRPERMYGFRPDL